VRAIAFAVIVLGLLFIWEQALREFVVSLVALAVAMVIATKELLMSILGSFQRASSRAFGIGDRIEVMGIRGDVIDHTLFNTTLLEIGPNHRRTGRTQVIPNSVFLSNPIANETFTEAYVLHTFAVPTRPEDDWLAIEARLLEAARDVCAEYIEAAGRHMDKMSRQHGLTPFSVEPRVTLRLDDPSRSTLLVRVPTPARERARTEQRILRRLLGDDDEQVSKSE
jgi:small-conductance mechanosensitive channel